MKKVISLIACFFIAIFAQEEQEQPVPPPQGQYVYPPQQQGQYVYPPPQQGQYIYPPPPQGQYVYPPPQQGQYVYPPPQYIYVQPMQYQQQLGNFTAGQRWGTWVLNTIIPGLGSAAIMNDYASMGIQMGLTVFGVTSVGLCNWIYCSYDIENILLPIGLNLLSANSIFNIARSISYDRPTNNNASYEYSQPPRGNFSADERWETWALNTLIPGSGSAVIMNDFI